MKRTGLAANVIPPRGRRHWAIYMSNVCLLVLFSVLQVNAKAFAQKEKVTFSSRLMSVEQVFDVITAQLKYDVFYSEEKLNAREKVELPGLVMRVDEVLSKVLGKRFTYSVEGKTIFIRPAKATVPQTEAVKIEGTVKDKSGMPLPGVTVVIKGTTVGTATDQDGKFHIDVASPKKMVLVFSFIGMQTKEIPWSGQTALNVVLEEQAADLDEVVVTGYFQRKAESFTGSATTYRAEDLKMVGKQNVLQSLRTLDPAFNIKENLEFGSDPNRMPDMEIRGKTSIVGLEQEYGQDPNQPLFILDGFEVPLATVVDLNMERVESITLLKDAASTAIYGSRAANGVVVIETKRPAAGKLRVNYTGDFSVSMPDLTVYNLMNASEKLEFELRAGVYRQNPDMSPDPEVQWQLDNLYNFRKHKVESGVNSYWLSEPVRTGFVHKHNLYLEGGDDAMRYGFGVSYGATEGVMKESSRDVFSGNVDLIYRKGKISFTNKLTLDYTKTSDPDVAFDQYTKTSPYYEKRDANGLVSQKLEWAEAGNPARKDVFNPLWDANQNNLHATHAFGVNENLSIEWVILQSMRLRGRLGVRKNIQTNEDFVSPDHSSFSGVGSDKKGSYEKITDNKWSYEGDLTLTYGDVLKETHRVNVVAGLTFSDQTSERDGYKVVGFPVDNVQNPSFSNQYPENSKASYSRDQKRAMSCFINTGYAYNERYLIDANLRIDGASTFGSNKRYTTTWSTGVSWNIHNESFIKGSPYVNLLKLRASIGNPGNLNFSGYNTFTTYIYNTELNNSAGIGAHVEKYGNPDLKWQKTLDLNVGLDLTLFNNRFRATVEAYRKMTDPLFVDISVASSTGSDQFKTNVGHKRTLGINARLFYYIVNRAQDNFTWNVDFNIRRQKSKLGGIGNSLSSLNEQARGENKEDKTDNTEQVARPGDSDFADVSLQRYYDGADPDALWAVRSAGIDPMTGKEVFIKKNGERTFEHDYADEVVIGIGAPKYEGVVGTNFYYKGFSVSVHCRYKFGEYKFNNDLYNKVENITKDTWTNNLDRRALYGRWKKPGDIAEFKGISIVDKVDPMSSRFIQKERVFSGESFSVGYEFARHQWLKHVGLRTLTVRAYMNEIFRLSNIKMERGTKYPFARTVSFSVTANF